MKKLLTRAIKTALQHEEIEHDIMVSFLLMENDEIRSINSKLRNNDNVTDVISFPMLDMENGRFKTEPEEFDMDQGMLFLGDIVISIPKAIEQAQQYGHCVDREVAFLSVHGLFHLLGYDHQTPEDEENMTKKQENVLALMDLSR
ncbi:MAG TPA: rRNA maturation RNase YbeY [Thermoclostridium sp.]|nr:rRNA maturation RNase YbeY [Thermoclostridium sp.]